MMQVSSTVLTKNCFPVHVFTSTEQELEVLFKILKLTNFVKIFHKIKSYDPNCFIKKHIPASIKVMNNFLFFADKVRFSAIK